MVEMTCRAWFQSASLQLLNPTKEGKHTKYAQTKETDRSNHTKQKDQEKVDLTELRNGYDIQENSLLCNGFERKSAGCKGSDGT